MEHVTIERLGHRGDGIAPGPVYAARTLPGERVSGTIIDNRINTPRILEPSEDRVTAPCAQYRRCGGCALQHARDEFVSCWRTQIVAQALSAYGLTTKMRPAHVAPPGARRRATFSGKRTKKGAMVGFHSRASKEVVPVPDCRVISEGLKRSFPILEQLTVIGASRKSEIRFTVTQTETGLDIAVSGGKGLDPAMRQLLAGFGSAPGLARLSWDDEPVLVLHPPQVRFGPVAVRPPPGAFLQATLDGEAALRSGVGEATDDRKQIADLFAGCGTFALPLAQDACVHAVEGDLALIRALNQGWRDAEGLQSVTSETRDLFRRPLLSDELSRFDAVVIDPPRAGAEAQMVEIARSNLGRVAALSCNPVTFARDAAILVAGGFTLDWLRIVDQFRWSPHIELVACLSRE